MFWRHAAASEEQLPRSPLAIPRPLVVLFSAIIAPVVLLNGTPNDSAVEQGGIPSVAFVNANVVPMTSDVVLPLHTVVVEGDRIVDVFPSNRGRLPQGVRTIDVAGKYLVPGLIDFHVHLRGAAELERYLEHGVTTVVAMRGTETVLELRDKVRSGALPGPRILTAGPLIDGDPPIWRGGATRVVTSAAEARAVAAAHCRSDFDVVKVYNNLRPPVLAEIVRRVHGCGLPVVAHLPRLPVREEGLARALAAGVDVIAHGEEVFFTHLRGASDALIASQGAAVSDRLIDSAARMIAQAGVHVVPTLSFIEMTRRMLVNLDEVLADPEFEKLPEEVQELWRTQNPTRRDDLEAFTRREQVKQSAVATLTRRLQDAGVPLLLGTDASAPGLFPGKSAHVELQQLVASGLTAFEAVAAGTRTAGQFFQRHLRKPPPLVGTIEPGKSADLLVVAADPRADVRHLARIEGVMVRGRWRPRSTALSERFPLARHKARSPTSALLAERMDAK